MMQARFARAMLAQRLLWPVGLLDVVIMAALLSSIFVMRPE
jgi:hypothetical protein